MMVGSPVRPGKERLHVAQVGSGPMHSPPLTEQLTGHLAN